MPLRRLGSYVLRGHEVVATDNPLVAAMCFADIAARTVRKTTLTSNDSKEESEVSTVFLGIDHNFTDDGPPIVFESLVFGGPMADWMRRYATWAEAEAGHEEMVELVRQAMRGEPLPPDDDLKKQNYISPTWHERVMKDDDDL